MHIWVLDQTGAIFPSAKEDNPWSSFFNDLKSNGHTIAENMESNEIEGLIFLGYHPEMLENPQFAGVALENRILVNWEPVVVEPELYRSHYYLKFGHRFSPSSNWAKVLDGNDFGWPQATVEELPEFADWQSRKNKAVMIQANKYSAHKAGKYRLRRNVIAKLGRQGLIDLYGRDWDKSPSHNLRQWLASLRRQELFDISPIVGKLGGPKSKVVIGSTECKAETYSNYKIAIVIENSLDYISEKLVDAVSAGCLTIYVGSHIIRSEIPQFPMSLLSPPTTFGICENVLDIISMPNNEKYALLRQQHEAIKKFAEKNNNFKVMQELGARCNRALAENP
jgi:hypothetical protein